MAVVAVEQIPSAAAAKDVGAVEAVQQVLSLVPEEPVRVVRSGEILDRSQFVRPPSRDRARTEICRDASRRVDVERLVSGAGATVDRVVPIVSRDRVVARPCGNFIVTVTRADEIVACAAGDQIVTSESDDHVVACSPGQDVPIGRSDDGCSLAVALGSLAVAGGCHRSESQK